MKNLQMALFLLLLAFVANSFGGCQEASEREAAGTPTHYTP